jgi:hypothetical protein
MDLILRKKILDNLKEQKQLIDHGQLGMNILCFSESQQMPNFFGLF